MPSYKDVKVSDNALEVLKRRYLTRDKKGRVIETPRDLFLRVAGFIAEADRNYGADDGEVKKTARKFFDLMASLVFLPNSPTLMNAGRPLGQLSACFVLPVGDSMDEIFETNKNAALIHKSGGGTGFAFSRLRPRNSIVASTSGVASGPVSFMKVYNASTEAVRQGGTRRGANMGILRIDHPDILEFVSCKRDTSEITNFNISVAVTEAFMDALRDGKQYPLYNPHTGRQHEIDGEEVFLDAEEVFDRIVDNAWATGEPGIIFIDRINQSNPTHPSESIEATNPCGEQPLPAYDSCNLGSVNLGVFVRAPLPADYSPDEPDGGIDWNYLGEVVREAVHFLDNVIDQNKYPIPEIDRQTKKNRRIGLGVMGWADMLVRLGLPYNDDRAFALAERTMAYIENEARKQSSELAKTRGKFLNWEGSVYRDDNVAMRNATVTTIAPAGTISIIAGCSSGVEPYYSIAFERNVMDGTRLLETNPLFKKAAVDGGFFSEELTREILSSRSLSEINGIPESVKALFLTAVDISAEEHIRMQAAFQAHCDASVSKTINFPESATREEVRQAFTLAYEYGCKGVTIYRDRSRPDQVLSVTETDERADDGSLKVEQRPPVLSGITEKIKTGYGNLYVTINLRDNQPFEVFAHIGKSGYTTMADTEAICRLISLALRSGVPVGQVIKQLRGIGGSSQVFSGGGKVTSIPDAIAQILNKHFGRGQDDSAGSAEICPQCSAAMRFDSGCFTCASCGYSTC
ncbi:MAG: vitamin B12-dependent ribonucleotide reductase [Candidatus Zixiibacteriota bacterium]|nr:MAG: vitamin B12-dependent ribonucleotide reductase [candidate division Zixibacteria bacterium]